MIDSLDMARALLAPDPLQLRLLAQEALRDEPTLSAMPPPRSEDPVERAAAASLVELLCERARVAAPPWTATVPGLKNPRHVTAAAATMPRLRALCERESPAPMKRRGFLAPPDFLTFA